MASTPTAPPRRAARSHAITLGVDIEPKALVSKPSDTPDWTTLDVTPSAEYRRGRWFDGVGELHLGRTQQTDGQDSVEVTPRIGLRFHVLSNIVNDLVKERQPRRRLVVTNLARVEWRNLHYSGKYARLLHRAIPRPHRNDVAFHMCHPS